MKTSSVVWTVIVIIIILGLGWYFFSNPNAMTPAPAQQGAASTTSATVLATQNDATLGAYIMSPVTGRTLYTYSNDTTGVSNCTGQCAVNWPPYNVQPGLTYLGAAGITGQLGSIVRADGNTQLTYNGMPLYTYIKDTKQGDTTGQNVGGVWFVAKP